MNEFERAEREAENDGCRNEYQRALAVSQMRHNSGRAYAESLVQQGRTVLVQVTTAYCPMTDGILGEHVSVLRTGDDRREIERWMGGLPDDYFDPEGRVEILEPAPACAQPCRPDPADEIPF